MGFAIWVWPEWIRFHLNERMNAFISGLIPLLAGGSVLLGRWLVSPYFVYKAERSDCARAIREAEKTRDDLTKKRADFIYQGVGSNIRLTFRINPNTNRPVARIDFMLRFQNKGEASAYSVGARIYDCWVNDTPPIAKVVDIVEPTVGRTMPDESRSLSFWAERPARDFNGQLGLNETDVLIVLIEIDFRAGSNEGTAHKNEPIWISWDPRIPQKLSDANETEVRRANEAIGKLRGDA